MSPLPAFHDDLAACLDEAWRLLEEGPRSRRNAFHMPTLATVDAQGRPQARTVVLREADRAAGALRFHCDRRSRKAGEIAAGGIATLQGYESEAKIQIRATGPARLHADDAVADAAWAGSMVMSRACYGAAPAPGAAILEGGAYALPQSEAEIAAGRPNFAAVVVSLDTLEFLYLDRRGHRRARWTRDGAGWPGMWLAP